MNVCRTYMFHKRECYATMPVFSIRGSRSLLFPCKSRIWSKLPMANLLRFPDTRIARIKYNPYKKLKVNLIIEHDYGFNRPKKLRG